MKFTHTNHRLFKNSMKPDTNCFNMHCLPILNFTESLKDLAHREVGLIQIAKFVPHRQEIKLKNY